MKKVLKVKLEPEVHEKFRTWAFNHRVTMQGELENYVGGLVNGGAPKTPAVPRKEPSIRSYEVKKVEVAGGWSEPPKTPPVATPAPKIGVPVEYVEGGVILEKCSKCGDKVPVSKLMMHPKFPNKKFCPDCVENMRNNQ